MRCFPRHVAGLALIALVLPFSSSLHAQRGRAGGDSSATGPLPLTPTRPLKFTTDEGTWLSLSVSPDGRTIAFDLLGDIYSVPVSGGHATRLTSGQAFDGQPAFSPDGSEIVFVSDRSGSDNLWLMHPDGSDVHALTHESERGFLSPTWSRDGKYVIASKNGSLFGSQYDLYMYNRNGGTGFRITGSDSAGGRGGAAGGRGGGPPNNFVGPAVGRDARYLYAAVRGPGGGYNQTSLGWQIGVFDRETGRTSVRTDAAGSGMRPELSPDGKWLTYGTRIDSVTQLRLRDLATGDEKVLIPKIQRDDQESRWTRDLLPTYAFMPDSKSLVIAYLGHIWRVTVPDGQATMIPFTADYDEMIAGAIKDEYPVNDSTLTVRQIRSPVVSPDGKRLAFTALDHLYVMDLPNGTPRRLTDEPSVVETSPAWSPDGRSIAYATWTEKNGGDVYRVAADGSGQPARLTTQSAFYENLTYNPDGTRIVVTRGPRAMRRGRDETEAPNAQAVDLELVWLPSSGGAATVIAPVTRFGKPHFGPDPSRIYVNEAGQGLVSMRWDGTDVRTVLRVGGGGARGGGRRNGASEILLSPDGQRAIVESGTKVYLITDVPQVNGGGATISIDNPAQSQVPVRRLSEIGGEFSSWTPDGKRIIYALGHSLFTYDLAAADAAIRDSTTRADSARNASPGGRGAGAGRPRGPNKPAYEAARNDIVITVPKDRPTGLAVLRGARIITMHGDEVIPKGDIVVRNNRIVAVGPQGKVQIPSGAHVIDVSGKTIIPGYVDVHAHMWPAFGVHSSQPWEYLAMLAYGVTTARDPQTSTSDVITYGDRVAAGEIIGPRVYSTGPGVFSSENIKSLDDARDVLKRYSEFWQTNTIKQYMTGDRRVRQWVAMAAREQYLMPTLEGGLDFKKNLTEAMDGYSGSEHTLPIAPLYKDVIELFATAGDTYTPTFIVQYGGPWAENYWYEHSDVRNDTKLERFTPPDEIQAKTLRRPGWWAPAAWAFPMFAHEAAKIDSAGGKIGVGGHGQLQGLGTQWEIWNIASGGMSPMHVLRAATMNGAASIGLDQSVGSLEAGKLADLQVLDKNPLDDIHNTNTIRYVMKNGRLYDGNTLNEIWPRQRTMAALWGNGTVSGDGQR